MLLGRPEPNCVSPKVFAPVVVTGRLPVAKLAEDYLAKGAKDLQPGGYMSMRFKVGLFSSADRDRQVAQVIHPVVPEKLHRSRHRETPI